ncbi:MAG: hypothetical protein AABZ64_18130, partial [Nitrospinota bacterium]
VFGRRAWRAALARVKGGEGESAGRIAIPEAERAWVEALLGRKEGPLQAEVRLRCRMLAHEKLGTIRDARGCSDALAEYARIEREELPRMRLAAEAQTSGKARGQELESALSVRNLALLGRLLATAALRREESRGAHYRLDFPERDDARWRVVTRLTLGPGGGVVFAADPVKENKQLTK